MMKQRLANNESGAIAIFLVIVLSILLVVTTLSAARLNVSELGQSSQVDRSDQSYYAAEAGVEEASRRLDNNKDITDLKQIFPEEYSGGTLVGDMVALVLTSGAPNTDFSPVTNPSNGIRNETGVSEIGQLSWRNRRVYGSGLSPSGTLVKDQSVQVDTTDLRRNCVAGGTSGPSTDCDGSSMYSNFTSMNFCWTPTLPPGFSTAFVKVELTAVSYPASGFNGATPVDTKKFQFGSLATPSQPGGNGDSVAAGPPVPANGYLSCIKFTVNQGRRYIFRMRPVIDQAGIPPVGGNQNNYSINYKVDLQNSPCCGGYALYPNNDTVLIDVTGQDGEIRRRIIAQKQRSGKLIGVFDFVLYQGDKVYPLCKSGVQQSDVGYDNSQCIALPIGTINPGQTN